MQAPTVVPAYRNCAGLSQTRPGNPLRDDIRRPTGLAVETGRILSDAAGAVLTDLPATGDTIGNAGDFRISSD
jgi:hypothetical protein